MGVTAVEILLLHLRDSGNVGPEHVLEPRDVLEAAFTGGGQDRREDIEVTQVRSSEVFERRIAVVLRMDRRVTSAVKRRVVVLLLPMIRQGLAGNLTAGDATAIGECSDE